MSNFIDILNDLTLPSTRLSLHITIYRTNRLDARSCSYNIVSPGNGRRNDDEEIVTIFIIISYEIII